VNDMAQFQSHEARQRAADLAIVLSGATGIAVAVALTIHPSTPDAPTRLVVLSDLLAGRSIAYTPYPVGYIAFAALAIRWLGMHGFVAAQGALYVATVLLSYDTLYGLRVSRHAALAGAFAVAVYPNLLFNIARLYDTGLSCFLVAAFGWLFMRLNRDGLSVANTAIGGTLFGLMLLIRPTSLTLAPVALWAVFHGRSITITQLARTAGACFLAVGVAAAVVIPLKGRFVIFDRYYGAYGFANGTHEHALDGILRDYNGEMAMPQSMQELSLPYHGLDRIDPVIADQYMRMAWKFIREHPLRYAVLEAFKVVNFFRPDYRNVEHSFVPPAVGRAVHTAIAALFFVWAALRWRCRHLLNLGEGLALILVLVLYLAPYVVTNTDPRYRVPLDSLLIIESVLCLSILWERRIARRLLPQWESLRPHTVNSTAHASQPR
jgi:hypothetical protein